jgi:DNA-binding MarR family transcriptional regulator
VPGKILQEIKQTRPFPSLEAETAVNLVRTADLVLRGMQAALKPLGLSVEQFNVLRILRGAAPDGLPCGEIGARMVTRDPDITRLLDRLESRKLIERARDTKDRRVVLVRIRPEGRRILSAVDGPLEAANTCRLRALGRSRLRQLVTLLEAVRAGAHVTAHQSFRSNTSTGVMPKRRKS